MDKQPASVRMLLDLARRLDASQKSVRQFAHVGTLAAVDGIVGRSLALYTNVVGKSLSGKAIPLVGKAAGVLAVTNVFTNFSLVCLQLSPDSARVTVSIKAKSRKAFQALRDFCGV
jgi:hypothetical protein